MPEVLETGLSCVTMAKPLEVIEPVEGRCLLSSYSDLEDSQILWLWERLLEERPEAMKICASATTRELGALHKSHDAADKLHLPDLSSYSFVSKDPAKKLVLNTTNGIDEGARKYCGQQAKEMSDLQSWLIAVLDQHERSMSRELVAQFESFRKNCFGDRSTPRVSHYNVVCPDAPIFASDDDDGKTERSSGLDTDTANPTKFASRRSKMSKISKFSKKKLNTCRSGQLNLLTDKEHDEVKAVIDNIQATLVQNSYNYEISHKLNMGLDTKDENSHKRLDMAMTFVILLNVVSMVVELEWESHNSQVGLEWERDTDKWRNAEGWFVVIEHIFNVAFIVEAAIRLRKDRWRYFRSKMNIIDFVLVLVASTQIYILEPFGVFSGGNVTVFKFIRLARFIRVLRIMRMKMFAALRVLVKTCISSMYALFWSMVLLFLIMIVSGLFLVALLKTVVQNEDEDYSLRVWIYRHYGSIVRASYTLFEVTLAGCWPQYFRPLIEQVSGFYGVFAVAYITIVVFAVIRIITAIFLKETLQVASTDSEMMVNEMRERTQKNAEKLEIVFSALDVEGRGVLNFDQFARIATHKDVKTWLASFELAVHDVEGLFHLLDDGDGEITYDEFIEGILRLKGQARSLDVVAIGRACDKIGEKVRAIDHKLDLLTSWSRTPKASVTTNECDSSLPILAREVTTGRSSRSSAAGRRHL